MKSCIYAMHRPCSQSICIDCNMRQLDYEFMHNFLSPELSPFNAESDWRQSQSLPFKAVSPLFLASIAQDFMHAGLSTSSDAD